jgi:peptidyl-prolyl cis-trans isomerase C
MKAAYATIVVLALGIACGPARRPDPVLLAAGSATVRWSEFERHVRALEESGETPLPLDVRAALIEPFLEGRVLVLEARRRELLQPGATALEEEAAVRQLLAAEVLAKASVSDDEVARHYREHSADFRVPETVTLLQILVATSNEARDVRRRLQKDPKSFELLARTRSRGPEAARGGLMGRFARGQLPIPLEDAAFALNPGATSDIVETPLGYHVLRMESREPARDATLEECRVQIRALLSRLKIEEGQRQFVRALLARAKVNHEAAYLGTRPR